MYLLVGSYICYVCHPQYFILAAFSLSGNSPFSTYVFTSLTKNIAKTFKFSFTIFVAIPFNQVAFDLGLIEK